MTPSISAFRHAVSGLLLTAASFAAMPSFAAAPASQDSLRACMAEKDSLRRLVCYDTAMARQETAASSSSVVPTPAAVVPAAPVPAVAPPVAQTEFASEQVRRRAGGDTPVVEKEASLTARITALSEFRPGISTITLDNGQVWRMQDTESYFPLAVGETTRIEKGMLGSYRLTRVVEGWNRWTRVVRLR